MSQHAALLETSLRTEETYIEQARLSRIASRVEPNIYTGLIARLFGGRAPLRVVAFASALPGEGVSYTVRRVAAELNRTLGVRATVLSAEELMADTAAEASVEGSGESNRAVALRKDYGVVLIDAGSMERDGSVIGAARLVDGIVMVVEADRTRKQEIKRAIDTITAAQGQVVGAVLNKHRRILPLWLERLLG